MSAQCFVPPYILRHILDRGDSEEKAWALQTLLLSELIRDVRSATAPQAAIKPDPRRRIFGARGTMDLPGDLRCREGEPTSGNAAIHEAYEALGATYDLFHEVFTRHSLDDAGLTLDATVHYGRAYDNAFWNGTQMVFGDGDGRLVNRFTTAPDVVGHELACGVTQYEARLRFRGEPGALNESFSDVLPILVKHRLRRVEAWRASWLIGEGLLTRRVQGIAALHEGARHGVRRPRARHRPATGADERLPR